jgi:hypothetical protein
MPRYVVEDILNGTGVHEVADPKDGEKLILELFQKQFPAHKETGHQVDIDYAVSYYCLMKESGTENHWNCACKELPGRNHRNPHLFGLDIIISPRRIRDGRRLLKDRHHFDKMAAEIALDLKSQP